jgi:60 kDa SS-A/Ro ribonucleoprotein
VAHTYLTGVSTRSTPQSQPIPGTDQVPNSAGGHAWAVDDWTRLHRFLILGTEGGSYYAREPALTRENADGVQRCITADGPRTVAIIREVSTAGRAPKNDPAIFALAMAAAAPDEATRKAALAALPDVCRIGTHLFHFAAFVEQFRGLRSAIGAWYLDKDPDALAYQLVKYRQRDGWSHRDLLRLAHPSPNGDDVLDATLAWAVGKRKYETLPPAIAAYESAQAAPDAKRTAALIRTYRDNVPREAINPEHMGPDVWSALLDVGMPMTALIRNLGNLTRHGVLTPTSKGTQTVVAQLGDAERLRKARVHPIQVLAALLTYASGRGVRGSGEWAAVPQVVDALDRAFYASFGNVEPTGKRWMLALDVSGSMHFSGDIAGVPGLTPRVASAALAMVTLASGDPCETVAFTGDLTPLALSSRQRLDDVLRTVSGLQFGRTDCALPMTYAVEHGREVDCFVVLTDSETWAGGIHPAQALRRYRERTGIDARLIVVGMVSNGFSIADPNDAGMLDVVGFDTATPQLMTSFAQGGF